MENFAVKSDSFALYEAFKKDVEKIGWRYNEKFTPFNAEEAAETNCLFFSNDWDGKPFACSFSLSNTDDTKFFYLETQYGEALAFAKKVWEQENKPKSMGCRLGQILANGNATCSISVSSPLNGTNPFALYTPHLVCPYNPAFYDTTHLDLVFSVPTISQDTINALMGGNAKPKFKTGDYLTMKNKSDTWIGVLRDKLSLGDKGFPFYAGLCVTGKLYINDSFGFQNGDTMDFSTPSEIALLDSKLAEQGKRFDKERCELVDIPKHKEPIIGEMAIFWDRRKDIAIISVFETKVVGEFTFRAKSEESFRNAILFESVEQYKDFLKS